MRYGSETIKIMEAVASHDFGTIYASNEPSDCFQAFGDYRENHEKLAKRVSHGWLGVVLSASDFKEE